MKIIAIGRNYKEHAKELNNNVPKVPIFFTKPDTALLRENAPFYLPDFSEEIHYEAEIVVKINKLGKHIAKEFAHRYYNELTIGIDFTARDKQRDCVKKGLPWEIAKAFDHSAPIGEFVDKEKYPNINNLNFELKLNDKTVQKSNTKHMIFSVDELIAYVSRFFTLKVGDLIFTGTPAGVGAVKIGDRLIASIENEELLDFYVK